MPDFSYEDRYQGPVCGVDEAGRGALAGPVVAAAVILDRARVPKGLDDSKKLSPARREALYAGIMASAQVGIGIGDVARIDRDNILQATLWAMAEAVKTLSPSPATALIDGNRPPALPCRTVTVVSGDSLSLSIAAASIIAKVTRDRMMNTLGQDHPAYGFATHKGYGTAAHVYAITRFGQTIHHRRSFKMPGGF